MRYFMEVSYKGTNYAGFQVQQNANTIQGEIEKAMAVIFRSPVGLTGSSRTDAGVHALQNFFHFDLHTKFDSAVIYNINALLPKDIAVKSIFRVDEKAHSRYLANAREYKYYISLVRNPFTTDTAWYYPYSLDMKLLKQVSDILYNYTDYTTFSKRNTQALTKDCKIIKSEWTVENDMLIYTVKANRFLRGMVRGLVGTMLLAGRKKISVADFEEITQSKDCSKANFSTPAHGLFLVKVYYPDF